jgi:hypothetical protein
MTRKIFTAAEGFTVQDLLHYGRDHIASANVLYERSYECFDSAGHLAHLGIELTLKAFLLDARGQFPHGHSLSYFLKKVKETVPGFVLDPEHEETVNHIAHFDEVRCPRRANPMSVGDIEHQAVMALFDALLDQMTPSMQHAFETRNPYTKGGRVLMSKPRDPPRCRIKGCSDPDCRD